MDHSIDMEPLNRIGHRERIEMSELRAPLSARTRDVTADDVTAHRYVASVASVVIDSMAVT